MIALIWYAISHEEPFLPLFLQDHYPLSEQQMAQILCSCVTTNRQETFATLLPYMFQHSQATPASVTRAYRELASITIQSDQVWFWNALIDHQSCLDLDLAVILQASDAVIAAERHVPSIRNYTWLSIIQEMSRTTLEQARMRRICHMWQPDDHELSELLRRNVSKPEMYHAIQYLLDQECPSLGESFLKQILIEYSPRLEYQIREMITWLLERFQLNPIVTMGKAICSYEHHYSLLVDYTREMMPRAIVRINECDDPEQTGRSELIVSDRPLCLRGWRCTVSPANQEHAQYHVYHAQAREHLPDAWITNPLANLSRTDQGDAD